MLAGRERDPRADALARARRRRTSSPGLERTASDRDVRARGFVRELIQLQALSGTVPDASGAFSFSAATNSIGGTVDEGRPRRRGRGGSGSTCPSGSGPRAAARSARPPRRRARDRGGRRAETGPPAPDRDEPDVHRPELAHPLEEVGVAGEVDRLRPRDDVADGIGRRAERARDPSCSARTARICELSDRERLADLDLERPTRTSACGAARRARAARRPGSSCRASRATAGRGGRSARARRARRRRRAARARPPAPSAAGARRGCAAAGRSADGRRRGRRRPSRARRIRFAPSANRYTQSLRPCASGSDSSFFSVLFSIWRIRSRVTPNAWPTSSSVHGCAPSRP